MLGAIQAPVDRTTPCPTTPTNPRITMSSSTLESSPVTEQQAAAEHDRFIRNQLNRTRFQVKVVELIASLMTIAAGLLAGLLCLAIIDHWILPLGFTTRLAAWAVLAGGTLYAMYRLVGPLLFRSINPIYAARAIEKQSPALKNSLINFLLLRSQTHALRRGMLAALGEQAAADLSLPDVDTDVDRSRVIKVGYLFVAILACCGIYKVLSPKDPFQSFQRVMIPWAKIAEPTRVLIADIQPGHRNDVYHGQTITISAKVDGLRDKESVSLVYESLDGQVIDQQVPMLRSEKTLRYEAQLPADPGGIQQDMQYYVQAGDARTSLYRLTVIPAPTIWVTRVHYEYPPYTKIPPRTVTRQGDLEAIEGTRVTVHAETNQAIKRASVVLATQHNAEAQRLRMTTQDQAAELPLLMQLDEERKASQYHSYRLEFTTTRGHESENPVIHRIKVTPDLPPEVEILQPQERRQEVPVTSTQVIEIRALDPDFGMSRVALRAVVGETRLLERTLFEDTAGQPGQIVRRYRFEPRRLGLKPGDEVSFRVAAWDNRVSAQGQPDPQVTRTADYTLVITAGPAGNHLPDEPQKQDGNSDNSPTDGQEGNGDGNADSQQPGGDTQGSNGGNSDKPPSEGAGNGGSKGENSKGENGDQQGKNTEPGNQPGAATKPGTGADAEQPQGDKPSAPNQGEPGESSDPENNGEASGAENQGQPGDNASSQPGDNEDLHDGEVFERILERIKRERQAAQDKQQGESDPSADSPDRQPGKNQGPGNTPDPSQKPGTEQSPTGDSPDTGTPPPKDSSPGDNSKKGDQPGTGQPMNPADSKPGEKPATPQDGKGTPGKPTGEKKPDSTGKGTGDSNEGQPTDQPKDSPEKSDGQGKSPADGKPGNQDGKPSDDSNSGESESAGNKNPPDGKQDDDKKPGNQGEASGKKPTDPMQGDAESSDSGSEQGSTQEPGSPQDPGNRSGEGEGEAGDKQISGGPRQGLSDRLLGLPEDLPDSDEANLDYARKATNLALEYLKDRQHNPDAELLEELGLTAEELKAMVDRYEKIQRQAEQSGEQVELDETLRSLGLRPSSRRRARRVQSPKETGGGLNEEGAESGLPDKFRQQFNAFKKGASRSRD
jgi:collagen type III alpha